MWDEVGEVFHVEHSGDGGARWWVMDEKGDGGLEAREVPVIGYAPVVEARGWSGIAWFAAGGFLLGSVAWAEKATRETSFWSLLVLVLMLFMIGWVVRYWSYWKSVAMVIGCTWGNVMCQAVARAWSGVGWSSFGNDGLALHLLGILIASSTGALLMGLLALASSSVRELLEYKGWIESRG